MSYIIHYRKPGRRKGWVAQKYYVPKQMYFNVNDENVMTLEYFNVETIAV
jgi:hypothetical protein